MYLVFRAWDKTKKKWVFSEHFNNISDFFIFIESNVKNYIVNEYTGYKDKRGNMIYDGDILKLKISTFTAPKSRPYISQVWWTSDGALVNKHPAHMIPRDTPDRWKSLGPFTLKGSKYLPIICQKIGNIYEDPNLIPNYENYPN